MKKFLIRIATILAPVFIGVAILNIVVDPANLYGNHNYEQDIVSMLINTKQYVTNVDNNPSYAVLKKHLCNMYNDSLDIVILGNSQCLEISSKNFPGKKILNLSIAGGLLNESCCMIYECYNSNKHPKTVLLGVDPFCFNDNAVSSQGWALKDTYNKYIKATDTISTTSVESFKSLFSSNKKWLNVISFSYFKQSVLKLRKSKIIKNKPVLTLNEQNETKTWRPDGSVIYENIARQRDQSYANEKAKELFHTYWLGYEKVSNENMEKLKKLINYIQKNNSEVIVLLCPYHPILWERFTSQHGFEPIINCKKILEDYLEKNKIETIGNWNPNLVSFNEEDFYDATHSKIECLDKILAPRFGENK